MIRERRESDLTELLELAQLVRDTDGYPPLGAIDVEHFLAPPYELLAWVALLDAKIVGHAALHSTGFPVTIERALERIAVTKERLGVIARMFVSPEVRGTGIPRSLLDTAVAQAHGRGLWPVLDTAAHFAAAIKFYESAGFERAGDVTFVIGDEPPLKGMVFIGPPPE